MRAIPIRTFGDPDGMTLVDLPVPTPGPGEVVIATEAIGVGGVDAAIRRGTLRNLTPTLTTQAGLVPGSEVAGRILGIGPGVDDSWLGRRVWAFTGTSGGYAEQAIAAIGDVMALPEALSSIDAVTLGGASVAHFALEHARFAAGDSVLVRGAAGSIGIAAVELAARAGAARIAVTTSSSERGRRLRDHGATQVLDRDGNDIASSSGQPATFDVILDIVAGPALPSYVERLAPRGRLVLVGMVAGPPPPDFAAALLSRFQRSTSVATFSLATVPRDEVRAARAELFQAAVRGELSAVVHDVLPLSEAAEAHRRMDAGEVFGRIVLTP